ncbi:MAG: type III-B CRISPR-associated protein Cas10/Cmr2 [Amphritea sp.]
MSSHNEQYFHLTLGPVQSFVGQARRTRDFWGGSFLLSWLSSVAMTAVKTQGGEILFPVPDEQFLLALQGKPGAQPPEQASVPNRFKALGARVDTDFDPDIVVTTLKQAWVALAQLIWEKDLQPHLSEPQRTLTRTLWERQVGNFWEINWCLTPEAGVSDLLDRRKNWRNHCLPDEPGVKCMMIEGFQELSGQTTPHSVGLNTFWSDLRHKLKAGKTDLRKGETLSALAFIKRRFVRHFADYSLPLEIRGVPLTLHGWPLKPQVPSVLYMAASPWYAAALRTAKKDPAVYKALDQFLDAAEQCADYTEEATPTREVADATAALGWERQAAGIDGVVFHASQLELGDKRFENPDAAITTQKALQHLRQTAGLPEPSSFYAVLLMDGDSLGSQMSEPLKQTAISTALQKFTSGVPAEIKKHSGFLIYAGGDDVLALMPVDHAVRGASALRDLYERCFLEQNQQQAKTSQISTSLSAAIQFAHIRMPLTFVLNDAHQLLDDVAKDKTGRDALAIRVRKPGGLHLEWSQPWAHLQPDNAAGHYNLLSDLADAFALREQTSPFTHRFIFKAIEVLGRLPEKLTASDNNRNSQALQTDTALIKALLKAELLHSGLSLENNRKLTNEDLDALLDPLIKLATPHIREVRNNQVHLHSTRHFEGDGLKLLRFLVQNSVALNMEGA